LIEESIKDFFVDEQSSFEELEKIIKEHKIRCPICGKID
jgi:glycyl-tRNA synthetase (class II)